MFAIVIIIATLVAGVVGTLTRLSTDGYRRIPTDPMRLP